MVDIVDAQTRSRMMSGIRSKNTQPEIMLRKAMHARGFRYRLHDRRLPGSPDLVFPKYKVAVFIHGCFWHRHPGCRYSTTPATRPEFWASKFASNIERDARHQAALCDTGWRVAVIWECRIRKSVDAAADELEAWLLEQGQVVG